MKTYELIGMDETGEAEVYDTETGKEVFSFCRDEEINDLTGLKRHLKKIGIMAENDILV